MKRATSLLAAAALLACVGSAAASLQSAEVTRVYNVVELLDAVRAPVPAEVGDTLGGSGAVQTGSKSRAELRFNDQTVARLGANSVFSFARGTRDLDLREGVILLQVPKNAGSATVNTAAVSAAITGTTVMIEFEPGSGNSPGVVKFIVLEGTMRLSLTGRLGESVLMTAGQILTISTNATSLPDPGVVDLNRLIQSSGLLSTQFSELENLPMILEAAETQRILKAKGKLINLNYGLLGDEKLPAVQASVSNQTLAARRTDAERRPPGPVQAPKPPPTSSGRDIRPPAPPPAPPRPPVPPKPPAPPKPPDCKRPPLPPAPNRPKADFGPGETRQETRTAGSAR